MIRPWPGDHFKVKLMAQERLDPTDLSTPAKRAAYLEAAMWANDPDVVLQALEDVRRARAADPLKEVGTFMMPAENDAEGAN